MVNPGFHATYTSYICRMSFRKRRPNREIHHAKLALYERALLLTPTLEYVSCWVESIRMKLNEIEDSFAVLMSFYYFQSVFYSTEVIFLKSPMTKVL